MLCECHFRITDLVMVSFSYCAENAAEIPWEYRGQTAENTAGNPRVSYAKRSVYNRTHHPPTASQATARGVGRGWNDQTRGGDNDRGGQRGGDNDNNEGGGTTNGGKQQGERRGRGERQQGGERKQGQGRRGPHPNPSPAICAGAGEICFILI